VHLAPVYNTEGKVACALGTMTVIDDVVMAREEASASRASLQRFLDAIDLPIAKWVMWNHHAVLDDCNGPYVKWADKLRAELIGKTLEALYGEHAWATAKHAFDEAFSGKIANYQSELRHGDVLHWARITAFPSQAHQGGVEAVYTVAFDIDAEMRAIDKLRESQRRLDVFTENIPNAMTYFDKDYVYRFVSKAFMHRYDKRPEDILGHKVWEARGQVTWEEYRPYAERAMAGEPVEFERQVPDKDGTLRWKRVQFTPDFAEDGTVKGVYSTRIDITDIKLAEAALKRDADWDSLTQTYNRNYFNAALHQALQDASATPFALLYLDLDGFKQVNDSMGHTVGDELLAHIAQSLKTALRADDTLARIGGDEFAVMSFRGNEGTPDTLAALGDRLLRAAQEPFRIGDITLSLSMSIGVVVVDSAAHMDVRCLLQKADSAMYEAKHAGKNRWVSAR
jgi:diguanylate cyclase (GGDEF)-like protein/PAS domain S-box-containing protein